MRALAALFLLAGCNSLLGIKDPTLVDDSNPGDQVDAGVEEPEADAGEPEDDIDAAPPADAGPDAPPPILGRVGDRLHGETTMTRGGSDYSFVRARFASGGSFRDYPGAIGGDGQFVIPEVDREGEYYLEVKGESDCYKKCTVGYFVTSARTGIDLGVDNIGLQPENFTGQARLLLNAGGLDPFSPSNHRLDYWIPNVGYGTESPNQPTLGTTTLSSFAIPWEFYGSVKVAVGDRVTFLQWGPNESTPLNHRKILKAFTASFDLKAGDNGVSGTFAAPAQTRTLVADWKRTEFHAHKDAMCPPSTRQSGETHALRVLVKPTPTYFSTLNGVTGFELLNLDETDGPDLNHTFSIPDPLPVAWPRIRQTYSQADCLFLGGTATPQSLFMFVNTEVAVAAGGAIRPIVSPPRALRIDGNDAWTPRTTATQVELSWTPPQVGTPDRYFVDLYQLFELEPGPDGTRPFPGARLMIKAGPTPKVIVPAGVLRPGDGYWLVVTAISGGTDPETEPMYFTHPYGSASAVTELMTVSQ